MQRGSLLIRMTQCTPDSTLVLLMTSFHSENDVIQEEACIYLCMCFFFIKLTTNHPFLLEDTDCNDTAGLFYSMWFDSNRSGISSLSRNFFSSICHGWHHPADDLAVFCLLTDGRTVVTVQP